MPYDVELAHRLQGLLAAEGVSEKKMFGGHAFLLDGHLAVAASGQGGLLVRVDPAQAELLLEKPGVEVFEMRGRPLTGWLRVDATALSDDAVLRTWTEQGLAYARSLHAAGAALSPGGTAPAPARDPARSPLRRGTGPS